MVPSLVLTELAPPEDTPVQPFPPDCAKLGAAVRPFTFTTTLPALNTAPQRDASPRTLSRTLAGQWSGAPIRATVPLPRRTRGAHSAHHAPRRTALPTRTAAPASRIPLRDDGSDSMDEDELPGVAPFVPGYDSESDSEGELFAPPARCYRYESITAAEGLDAWSFEELRVECYAQTLIARGTKPPPVIQPSLAIPPAFVSRIVPRN